MQLIERQFVLEASCVFMRKRTWSRAISIDSGHPLLIKPGCEECASQHFMVCVRTP